MKYHYFICDVFTEQRFGGNQLAVLPDAQKLSDWQMQQVAREFNFSETAFVLPAETGHTRKVRIFTPTTEIPFAGHPNIGTAFVLAETGALGKEIPDTVLFEEKAGLVSIEIQANLDSPTSFELKAPQVLTLQEAPAIRSVAKALSLRENEIVVTTHAPTVASVGLPFLFVEVLDLSVLSQVRIDMAGFDRLLVEGAVPYVHVYTPKTGSTDIQARVFAPLDGVAEDPATGSANCALAALLSHYRSERDGEFSWCVFQGIELGRPSALRIRARKENGCVVASWVGGTCVMISEGWIDVGCS
ncbi:MAG: PhzF family phenazine biosynthesis protein [Arenicellales bacterium]|nr:PhzF family phenazine biosynthesis protein [Arenicellales bacterium]MDP7616062.1 PhzF family phenazine biosynthesis protein [Arenicellales bacterium]